VFVFQDTRGRAEVAFTDRHGGVSGGPYASLDLAVRRGSDSGEQNIDILRHAVARGHEAASEHERLTVPDGIEPPVPHLMRQVHGASVHVIERRDQRGLPTADGLVTRLPGVMLVARVADCVPVVLADPQHEVVGVAHAGRQGLVAGIVPNTVAAMRDAGATEIVAWVGPHVCGACYEVPVQMRAEVTAALPATYSTTSWGTPALDIGAGVHSQLAADSVEVVDVARCTMEDEDLYSYRRQGQESGRMAGVVWLRP